MTFANLSIDAVNRAIDVRECASGKSINVARVAHTLGEKVIATGILGGDRASVVRRDLDRAGIPHDFVEVDARTRMCVTVIDQAGATATELIEESSAVRKEDSGRLLLHLAPLLDRAKVLVMSGTIAPELGDDLYARCVRLARERGIKTIVDAKRDPLMLALRERPTVVKPNRAELSQTVGEEIASDASLESAIRRCIELGAEWVAVTNGARETVISDGSGFWSIPTPRVNVVSPIGSGDAFAAGVAVGIVRGLPLPDACALGVACGAANAQTALAGHVERPTVEALNPALRAAATRL